MEKTTLSESTKDEVQVMTMEYTSSDEGNCETESDSEDSTNSERDIPRNMVSWAVRRPAPASGRGLMSSSSASSSGATSFSGTPLSSSTPRRLRPVV